MKKKSGIASEKIEKETPQKGIVIAETAEDVVLGGGIVGDPEDFKNEVKKEADKGRILRVLVPIFVFLLLGALVGLATWYYQSQSTKESPKKVEEKIQTPPTPADTANPVAEPTDSKNGDATDVVNNPDTPVSSEPSTGYTTYTVKANDTLSTIANANDMTSTELAKYNNISVNDPIQIGQKIKIPSK